MREIALSRLSEERKQWRRNHPFGFVAKPKKKPDGTLDLLEWECVIPGRAGTIWAGGRYKLIMTFPKTYPSFAPKCQFVPPLYHVNIFSTGVVCLSLLDKHWNSELGIRQILLGIQHLLNEPNAKSPAGFSAYRAYTKDRERYDAIVRAQALEMSME